MNMKYSISELLTRVRRLKENGEFVEALQILNELEKKEDLSLQEQFDFHHLKGSLLSEVGSYNEAFKYVELAYKDSHQMKNDLQIIDVLISKSSLLLKSTRLNEALNNIIKVEQILKKINQVSSKEYKEKYASLILLKGHYYWNLGDSNHSLECANEVLAIAEEIENVLLKISATKLFGLNYSLKGELELNIENNKRFLALAKKLNIKQEVIGALNGLGMILTEKQEFDQALNYLKEALSICDEIKSFKKAAVLSSLLDLYLEINNLDKAQQCLDQIKQIRNQEPTKWYNDLYQLEKAELLKKKPQDINKLKAREIYKQLVDKGDSPIDVYYCSLINLCDSYLKELQKTNDLKILDEIQPYIKRLMNIAKSQQSSWLLVEMYLFQAKLKLISFEFNKTQKFQSQALDIAEKYGQTLLAERVRMEQDELLNEKIKWEKLRKSQALMAERIESTDLDSQIGRMLRKRSLLK